MRRRRSLRTASATPEARCTLEAGRSIQLRPDAKDTQTTALPGSHHAIAARARPPSRLFRNVDSPPAAPGSARSIRKEAAHVRCDSGFWGGQRPSLAHYVTGMGPMDGATAAGGVRVAYPPDAVHNHFPFDHRS